MKNRFLILILFTLVGCTVSKKSVESTVFESTSKRFDVDTTIKFLQPIKGFVVTSNVYEAVNLETSEYKFTSEMNFETGKVIYTFKPKKDTIEQRVKLQVTEKTEKKVINKTTTKKVKYTGLKYLLLIAFVMFIISLVARYYIKKLNI